MEWPCERDDGRDQAKSGGFVAAAVRPGPVRSSYEVGPGLGHLAFAAPDWSGVAGIVKAWGMSVRVGDSRK